MWASNNISYHDWFIWTCTNIKQTESQVDRCRKEKLTWEHTGLDMDSCCRWFASAYELFGRFQFAIYHPIRNGETFDRVVGGKNINKASHRHSLYLPRNKKKQGSWTKWIPKTAIGNKARAAGGLGSTNRCELGHCRSCERTQSRRRITIIPCCSWQAGADYQQH